ncbi:hypothetical protein [Terrabacter sp. RAF57]|uniref:hypothetical protein n=1 Tax=Terrabacter sp. RAF57 TaxID=3233063 RepID=UPI003F9BDB8C
MPPLAIWLAFTVVGAVFLTIGATHQVALERSAPGYHVTSPMPAAPGYLGVVQNWDGNWYRSIAENGYPSTLSLDGDGVVQQNEWAFYPAYPMLVRGVASATGMSFAPSAWVVSLLSGAAAMVALFNLVRVRMGLWGAGALVACVMAYVSAPVLQVAYTEGLALLLIVLFIGAAARRRLAAAVSLAVVLSLTRPIALPLGVVLGVVLFRDWRLQHGEAAKHRLPVAEVAATIAVLATAGLWPLVAWATTGRRNAFFETQAAWPVNDAGLGGWAEDMLHLTPRGIFAIGVLLYVAVVCLRPGAERWGRELRLWSVAYPLYLILASRPSPSILRYLMLAIAPLWPFPGVGVDYLKGVRWAPWAILGVVITTGLVAQYYWVTHVFTVPVDPSHQPFP